MKYIITNFAYGTGPYLRTTELGIAINSEREKQGKEVLGIIVPWVYGERQLRIMREEFGAYDKKYPGIILLDKKLGEILKKVFYGDNSYEEALQMFVSESETLSREAHKHLSQNFEATDLQGNIQSVQGRDIVVEVNRAPRIMYDVAPAYSVTFGYISEILGEAIKEPEEKIKLDRILTKEAIAVAEKIEASSIFHALAYPGTFSYQESHKRKLSNELLIPPTITPPISNLETIDEGIYVTITGIPGLERLYEEAKKLGLKLYSNDTKAVSGSEYLSPHYISNPNIKLQFARSGWGSIWLSQFSGTPFVAPEFDPYDDPEIYFNNLCIEKLELGIIYHGQSLQEIINQSEIMKPHIQEFNQMLLKQFGILDGNEYVAKLIAEKI